jgi:hypothetical protein
VTRDYEHTIAPAQSESSGHMAFAFHRAQETAKNLPVHCSSSRYDLDVPLTSIKHAGNMARFD